MALFDGAAKLAKNHTLLATRKHSEIYKYLERQIGCGIFVDKDMQKKDHDSEAIESTDKAAALLRGGKVAQISEMLGLTQQDLESIYMAVAKSEPEKFEKFVYFMKDFGVKESLEFISRAKEENGKVNPEALILLFLDALHIYRVMDVTSEQVAEINCRIFDEKELKGADIVKDYRIFAADFIEDLKRGSAIGYVDPEAVSILEEKLNDIAKTLLDEEIPKFYKIKKSRDYAVDYFR